MREEGTVCCICCKFAWHAKAANGAAQCAGCYDVAGHGILMKLLCWLAPSVLLLLLLGLPGRRVVSRCCAIYIHIYTQGDMHMHAHSCAH